MAKTTVPGAPVTTRLLVGDVFDRMAELEDGSFDLIVTSPPFGWLRSYLPDGTKEVPA